MEVRRPGLLDTELQERERLPPSGGSFNFKYNTTNEATLTIPEDGPAVKMHDWIALYGLHGFLGVYRVVNIAQAVGRQIQLSLLHGIDILSDSVWEPATVGAAEETFTGSMTQYLTALLAHQTHLITIGDDAPVRPWVLGTCESTEVVNKKISYNRLSDLLADVVPEGGDYELTFDMTVFPWRVNLVEKDDAVAGEFRAAHNMSGVTITYNDADLCTRLVLSNTHGSASKVKIYEAGAIAQNTWGIVTKTASIDTNDDLTAQAWPEADAWAETFFALHAQPSVQVQVEGEDLSAATGDTWDEASLGRMVRVPLPDYGFTVLARAVAIDQPDPYGQPERVVVSLANSLPQFSEQIKIIEKTASSAYGRAGSAAQKAEEADEKADEVIYRTDYMKTDRGIGMLAQAIGVKIDPTTHLPLYNETTGEYAFEGNNGATLTGHLSIEAAKVISEVTIARGDFTELGSRLTQMADDIEAKVNSVDLDTKVAAEGFIKITAANNAAKAVVGASLLDNNGVLSVAKIVSEVNGTTGGSKISLDADHIEMTSSKKLGGMVYVSNGQLFADGDIVSNAGTIYAGDGFEATGNSKFEGNVVIDGYALDLVNGASLKVGGTAVDPVASIAANANPPSGQIGITVTPMFGSAYNVNFNIAATQTYIDGVAAAKRTALQGVNLSGWQLSNGSAVNLVRDGDNNTLQTVSMLPAANWDVTVGSWNRSTAQATVTFRPVISSTYGNPVKTATVTAPLATPGTGGTITPTSTAQTFDVPAGSVGWTSFTVAAASGGDGYTEIDLNGDSSSGPSSSKPSTNVNKSVTKISGYIWGKSESDGLWYRIRYFEITTGAQRSLQGLYYASPGSGGTEYKALSRNTLYYYT